MGSDGIKKTRRNLFISLLPLNERVCYIAAGAIHRRLTGKEIAVTDDKLQAVVIDYNCIAVSVAKDPAQVSPCYRSIVSLDIALVRKGELPWNQSKETDLKLSTLFHK